MVSVYSKMLTEVYNVCCEGLFGVELQKVKMCKFVCPLCFRMFLVDSV